MRNWLRIALVVSLTVGGAGVFGYYTLARINSELDNLSAAYVATINRPPPRLGARLAGDVATSTNIASTTAATSTEPVFSLSFPKGSANGLYSGCVYTFGVQYVEPVAFIEAAIIDAATGEALGPIASGFPKSYTLTPAAQSVAWKVNGLWAGEYSIRVSKINGAAIAVDSKRFAVRSIPEGVTAVERAALCKGSGGVVSQSS